MPQTVLRGPNGGPAVDNATGMQLTMEEMLRRNGIVQMGNNVSMLGPQAAPAGPVAAPSVDPTTGQPVAASPASGPGGAVQAAMAQRSSGAPVADATDPTAAQGSDEAALAELDANDTDPSVVDMLETAGLVAVGTAAAYAAYRAMRGRGTPQAATAPSINSAASPAAVSGTVPANMAAASPSNLPAAQAVPNASNIMEGEFTEVDEPKRVAGSATQKAMAGRGAQKALPAPQKKLPNNGRSATARAMQGRAAEGSANSNVIAGRKPTSEVVRGIASKVPEAARPAAGIPAVLAELLKANPGIAKLLTRVP